MGVKSAGGGLRAALRVVLLSHVTSFMVLMLAGRLRRGPVSAWRSSGLGGSGRRSGRALADVLLHRALAWGDGRVSGGKWTACGCYPCACRQLYGRLTRYTAHYGVLRSGGRDLADCGRTGEGEGGAGAPRRLRSRRVLDSASTSCALKMAGPAGVIWPMATARMGSLTVCSLWVLGTEAFGGHDRSSAEAAPKMTRRAVLWSLSTALLDTSGNLLFVAATRAGRLDVAAVLASLYPASTILLAAWMLRERPTRRQALGMGVAVLAVADDLPGLIETPARAGWWRRRVQASGTSA